MQDNLGVDTYNRVKRGIALFDSGKRSEFSEHLQGLRKDDPLAADLLRVMEADFRSQASEAFIHGRRLIPRVSGKPELAGFLFYHLGRVYRRAGEMAASDNYFHRVLEIGELTSDPEAISRARLMLLFNKLCRAEYESLRSDLKDFNRSVGPKYKHYGQYFAALLEIVRGKPIEAIRTLNSLIESSSTDELFRFFVMEIKGLAARLTGKLEEAMGFYLKSAQGLVELGSAYAAFPLEKAVELSRLAGLEPPTMKTIRKCLSLARRGSLGEEAAAREIVALMAEEEAKAAEGIYDAAVGYYRGHQPIEAFMAGLLSAHLAWRVEGPIFQRALKFIAPLAPLHPGFEQDPFLGGFLASIKPFLSYAVPRDDDQGIKAHLIGEMRVLVNGRDILARKWGKRKAIRALVYLLLSPKHRIARDHLFYLLWPRRRYNEKTRQWLYVIVNTIRRHLGSPDLITMRHEYYQLEGDVWTDLGEMENLLRLAEASRDPDEREALLAKARELARGELLPEIIDDHYVDEYRQYYEGLKKRLSGKTE